MSTQDKIEEIKSQKATEIQHDSERQATTPDTKAPSSEMWYAIASVAFTIAAWCFAALNAWAAIGLSAIAIALGVTGKKCQKPALRNATITAIIAATVLLVVIAAFLIVVYLGLS